MSIGSAYWRKEVESLKSQLQEKNEDLDSLKRSYDFTYESLTQLRDKLENCPVSGEVVLKIKGIYHTFFKAKINHPDYMDERLDETDRQFEEMCKDVVKRDIHHAALKIETPDGKELDPKGEAVVFDCVYENPVTREKVFVKGFTKYDLLKIKYDAECEENARLQQRVAEAERQCMELRNNLKQQKSENEVLHLKVNDLGHKFCQARRERDKLAQKLREAEVKAQKYGSLLEKLSYLIYKETTC